VSNHPFFNRSTLTREADSTASRRSFLGRAAAAGLGLIGLKATSRAGEKPEAHQRIAVSTWSFHNLFPNTRYGNPDFPLYELDLREFPALMRDRFGITHFEISTAHFAAITSSYLNDLKRELARTRTSFIHLSDNIRGTNLARENAERRTTDTATFCQWIDIAHELGIASMRVNTGKPEREPWDFQITIETFRELARYGQTKGVEIVIENHGGLSADPRNVARIIEAVKDNISVCPDFGLFPTDSERWAGLRLLAPYARRICSAKFHDLDGSGNPPFDFERCLRIMRESHFRGYFSLKYEGEHDPFPRLEQAYQIVRRHLSSERHLLTK
jgi:sugar phosphate isomerase/epimerase